jgi:hypothetical protein
VESDGNVKDTSEEIGRLTRAGGCHVCVQRLVVTARRHRKRRDAWRRPAVNIADWAAEARCCFWSVRARQQGSGNEAGMCPGINGFTKYAPIADSPGQGPPVRPSGGQGRVEGAEGGTAAHGL